MNRFQTAASRAEEKVREIIPPHTNLYRPWQLAQYIPDILTLKCTPGEVVSLFDTQARDRQGFQVENGKVQIPNLFVKLSGDFAQSARFSSAGIKKSKKKGLVFDSIADFDCECSDAYSLQNALGDLLNPQGQLDKSTLYFSGNYHYDYLRKEYQDILIDRINYIIANKEMIFDTTQVVDLEELVSALLNINLNIIMLYQSFDFQFDIPYIVIHNEDRRAFTRKQGYVLTLLNLLGFDIIIISGRGYADIENIIKRDVVDVHYNNISSEKPFRKLAGTGKRKAGSKFKRVLMAAVAVVIGISLVTGAYSYVRQEGIKFPWVQQMPENAYNVPVEQREPNIGLAVKFKDTEFEKKIRKMMNRPDGPIYDIDLLSIHSIYIYGELTDKNEFVRAGSDGKVFWYEDSKGNRYSERSNIRSLEDLKWFRNLQDLVLEYHEIEDISVLAELHYLRDVNLSNNTISDISALGKLDRLESIMLDNNKIMDISPLKNLKNVKQLGLENNLVTSIDALRDYKVIELLNLNRNKIKDISFLKNLKALKFLYISQNMVEDLSPVAGLYNLEKLLIDGNPIKDFSVLGKLSDTEVYR